MGILDNLKNRFNKNSGRGEDYEQEYYDEYDNDDAYRDAYGDIYAAVDDQYEYDEPGYSYDDAESLHAPLVNMTDIRSQPISFDRGAGSREDRIPQPLVRERRPPATVSGLAEDDSEAFRDSLARSPQNSLVQLHSERNRLEANMVPEFNVPEPGPASRLPDNTGGVGSGYRTVGGPRSNAGAVTSRGPRLVEQLQPKNYADAEAISISLRQGSAVVLDLTEVRPELAKRILDFAFGVTSAFEGQVDRFADRVYILTRNGALTDLERTQIRL